MIALDKCIEKFDPSTGNIFNAYAKTYINGAIMDHTINTYRFKSIEDGKSDSKGQNRVYVQSLDDPISGDRGEWADKDQTLADKIPDESPIPGEESQEDLENKFIALSNFIQLLPSKEKTALEMYFVGPGKKQATYEEIGNVLGMSKMGVQKLLKRVVGKLFDMAVKENLIDPERVQSAEDDPAFYDNLFKTSIGKKVSSLV